ncbi:hypothetical protein [Chamaesiphon sp. OTE_8_metabat_110]|uniref:hypothetical protein n=1 Tax=Chamaesiphon sp. OTE_8_metabat_110 TaxID=2964696 RepID=UPI00286CBD47|nr:hypothetical protein [Chamaesiphon sp. OTE_8_metabat_110]
MQQLEKLRIDRRSLIGVLVLTLTERSRWRQPAVAAREPEVPSGVERDKTGTVA